MGKSFHQGMVGRTSHGERASCPAGTRRRPLVWAREERSEESRQGRGWAVREPSSDPRWQGHHVSRGLAVIVTPGIRVAERKGGGGRPESRSKARRTKRWKQTKWESGLPGRPNAKVLLFWARMKGFPGRTDTWRRRMVNPSYSRTEPA